MAVDARWKQIVPLNWTWTNVCRYTLLKAKLVYSSRCDSTPLIVYRGSQSDVRYQELPKNRISIDYIIICTYFYKCIKRETHQLDCLRDVASGLQTYDFPIGTTHQRDDVRDRQRDLFQNCYIFVAPAVAPHMRAHMLRSRSRWCVLHLIQLCYAFLIL